MRDLVDDEVLATFAVVAGPGARWPRRCAARYDGLVDRFSVYASYPAPLDLWDPLVGRVPLTRASDRGTAVRHTGSGNHCQ